MSATNAQSAAENANNADHATCPTCGRPISAAPAAAGISALRPNCEASLEAIVASAGPTREVDTSRGPAEVADATLQDATGTVKLVLWGPQIAKVQPGNRVRLAGAWVKEYRGRLQLSLGSAASMTILGPENRGPSPRPGSLAAVLRRVREDGGPRANASMSVLGP